MYVRSMKLICQQLREQKIETKMCSVFATRRSHHKTEWFVCTSSKYYSAPIWLPWEPWPKLNFQNTYWILWDIPLKGSLQVSKTVLQPKSLPRWTSNLYLTLFEDINSTWHVLDFCWTGHFYCYNLICEGLCSICLAWQANTQVLF